MSVVDYIRFTILNTTYSLILSYVFSTIPLFDVLVQDVLRVYIELQITISLADSLNILNCIFQIFAVQSCYLELLLLLFIRFITLRK